MTPKERKLWYEGKELWYKYIDINGYSFKPTNKGFKVLSETLSLKQSHVKERINFYLES